MFNLILILNQVKYGLIHADFWKVAISPGPGVARHGLFLSNYKNSNVFAKSLDPVEK